MTMLAGYKALLGRYAGQDDVAVGVAIANRTRREVEGLIGFFVNTLVLRTDLSGVPGFGRLVEQVRETALAAYAHQDLPFERLVEELAPERDAEPQPAGPGDVRLPELPRAQAEVEDLVLSVPEESAIATGTREVRSHPLPLRGRRPAPGGPRIQPRDLRRGDDPAPDRRFREPPRRGRGHARDPCRPVAAARAGGGADRSSWSGTPPARPGPPRRIFRSCSGSRSASAPDAPAVVFGDQTLSYAELDRRSARWPTACAASAPGRRAASASAPNGPWR